MKLDVLGDKMKQYENGLDFSVLPENYIIARLDGRGFTRLTKKELSLEKPFDQGFRDAMIETSKGLMDCGFKVVYGYTQSDEISLLFDLEENSFDRKSSKLNSVLAGEASARFSMAMGRMGVFDCRLSVLPNPALVVDYFRWRNEDAARNALFSWAYWQLRKSGTTARQATAQLSRLSVAEKQELLFQLGVNFNDVPAWQKRGVGLYYKNVSREGFNPITKEPVSVMRRQLFCEMELPLREAYSEFLLARF